MPLLTKGASMTNTPDPVWLVEAKRFTGLKEGAGSANNPTVLGWAKALGGWVASFFTNDAIAWCGLFISHCIAATLPGEKLPSNPLGALNWQTFGLKLDAPALGAVLVFQRPGGGHVGFYVGEDADAYHVFGGNQSDSVNVTRVAKSRLVAIRWPSKAPAPAGGRIFLTPAGSLSRNEA